MSKAQENWEKSPQAMKNPKASGAMGGVTVTHMTRTLGSTRLLPSRRLASRSLQIVLQVGRHAADRLRAKMSSMRLAASGANDSVSMWELLEAKAKLAGATEVELTVEEIASDTHITAGRMRIPESNSNSPADANWDIRFGIIRGHDHCVRIIAKGCSMVETEQQAFESLPQLCTEICKSWPLDSPEILSIHDQIPHSSIDVSQVIKIDRHAA